jgi:hypothetical protein
MQVLAIADDTPGALEVGAQFAMAGVNRVASANAGWCGRRDLNPHALAGTGTKFTVEAAESVGRQVIRFRQGGREYARAYKCWWGHYYNCNRTRIGMYCAALDAAAKAWFERKVAELKAEAEKLPADRQEQLKRELEDEGDRKQ